MATSHEVGCINKTNRESAHERIQNIGGVNPDGTRWKLSVSQAIADIKADKYKFYVSKNGSKVNVIIARSASGNEYLKTENDGEQPNNLLSLQECPA